MVLFPIDRWIRGRSTNGRQASFAQVPQIDTAWANRSSATGIVAVAFVSLLALVLLSGLATGMVDSMSGDVSASGGTLDSQPLSASNTQIVAEVTIVKPIFDSDTSFTYEIYVDGAEQVYAEVQHNGEELVNGTVDQGVHSPSFGSLDVSEGDTLTFYIFENQEHWQAWRNGDADPLDADQARIYSPNVDIHKPVVGTDSQVTVETSNFQAIDPTSGGNLHLTISGQCGVTRTMESVGETTVTFEPVKTCVGDTVSVDLEYDGRVIKTDQATVQEAANFYLDVVDAPDPITAGETVPVLAGIGNNGGVSATKDVLMEVKDGSNDTVYGRIKEISWLQGSPARSSLPGRPSSRMPERTTS